jgi:uncharacterized OB-fold protein
MIDRALAERYMPADWTLPLLNECNRPFFTSGELRVQRCEDCGCVQHPPMDLCRHCQSRRMASEPAAGTGTISSFTLVHHAVDRRLQAVVPYNVVIVELDDHPGVMVVGNVVGADPALAIGAKVRCGFAAVRDDEAGETIFFPQWSLDPEP